MTPSAATVAQCVVAGVVVGLCALQWAWWRGELREPRARLILAWSVVLAAVSLANGLLGVATSPAWHEAMLAARFAATGVGVVLGIRVVAAYAGRGAQASGRRLTWALTAWFVVAALLWPTTRLLRTGEVADGLPVHGSAAAIAVLVPVAAAAAYVAVALGRRALTREGGLVVVTATASVGMLVASTLPPPSELRELLAGVWVVPLAVALQVLAGSGITSVRRDAETRARMREAVATVANAAWFVREPAQVLERAVAEVRDVLDDPDVEGSLRPLARDRFVAEFTWPDGRRADPDTHSFLRDMARVVAGASERHALTDRLRQAAFTDSLTELHNRHGLDRYLVSALERAVVEQTQVAVLFCDLDGLKKANDRHGHAWGDALIVRTAEHLRAVVPEGSFVARHGGDEFVVVLERSGAEHALTTARRVREGFAVRGDDVGTPSVTVGVATWSPREVVDAEDLVRRADLAMLEAKRTHRGVLHYDDDLHATVTAEAELARALEDGVRAGDIVARFQPLIDARTLEVVGLEVLARWSDGGRLREPAEWLPYAERTGLVVEVGKQVFAAARRGMAEFDLPVSVNVAARQLDEADFVRHVEESWGTDAWDRLTIEVTESDLLYDAAHVRAALAELAARGARISIDDFGTGYNSLARLGELPLHELKIDRAFVKEVRTPEGAAVLKAILALAEAHGLDVVAEGVEEVDELTRLVELGVGTVQGFMLGRPVAEPAVRGRRARAAARSAAARHLAGVREARSRTRVEVPRPAGPADESAAGDGTPSALARGVRPAASASAAPAGRAAR